MIFTIVDFGQFYCDIEYMLTYIGKDQENLPTEINIPNIIPKNYYWEEALKVFYKWRNESDDNINMVFIKDYTEVKGNTIIPKFSLVFNVEKNISREIHIKSPIDLIEWVVEQRMRIRGQELLNEI